MLRHAMHPLTDDRSEAFGRWLRRARLAAGLSKGALARRAGCSDTIIRYVEAGHRVGGPRLRRALLRALDEPTHCDTCACLPASA